MSTKGRFAVNAMIDLTLRERSGPVALAAIATRQQISLSYLEQLFSRLRRAGLVQSTRGPGGGYTLGRDAAEISVADVMLAVEDGELEGEERGREEAPRGPDLSGSLWSSVQHVSHRPAAAAAGRQARALDRPEFGVCLRTVLRALSLAAAVRAPGGAGRALSRAAAVRAPGGAGTGRWVSLHRSAFAGPADAGGRDSSNADSATAWPMTWRVTACRPG